MKVTQPLQSKEKHFEAAVDWLKLAHQKSNNQGVSYGYSIKGGWRGPYRETTGYIAVTFFNLAKRLQNSDYRERALQMCEWELTVQNQDGSISNPHFYPNQGIVFDTGQVIFGLVRAFEETQDQRFLDAAKKAANWLIDKAADENLRWTKCTHKGIPHVYNSRVAWSVLRLHQNNPEQKWLDVACSNLDFAVEQQKNGWFDQCAFESNVAPFTHTIAYAIRGLYESSQILSNEEYLLNAETVALSCVDKVSSDGFIPGQIAINGDSIDSYCCLTGNCQLAIVWAKMYKRSGNEAFKTAAIKALKYVMERQLLSTMNNNIKGAIKGSYPIWGPYSRLTFPNWPTKFFVDAMIECWEWL
jgi:uncharacterized protein YyaL (SSP411 family)